MYFRRSRLRAKRPLPPHSSITNVINRAVLRSMLSPAASASSRSRSGAFRRQTSAAVDRSQPPRAVPEYCNVHKHSYASPAYPNKAALTGGRRVRRRPPESQDVGTIKGRTSTMRLSLNQKAGLKVELKREETRRVEASVKASEGATAWHVKRPDGLPLRGN